MTALANILVVAEHDNASIKGATLNTVTAAAACGGEVHVLVAGHNAGAAAAAAAQIAGVAKVMGSVLLVIQHWRSHGLHRAAQAATVSRSFSTQELAATSESTFQSRGRFGWRQQGLRKALLIGRRQADNFGSLNSLLCGVLYGRHHEICHGAPLKCGGTLDHRMQIDADSGFETSGRSGDGHSFVLLIQTIRQFAVR